jgi:hypothetical protein
VVQILGQSNKQCSNTQAVAVHSTCGAGGSGCSLLINSRADPIASRSVVAHVHSIIGIRWPKNLKKQTSVLTRKLKKKFNFRQIPYGRRLEISNCTANKGSICPYCLRVVSNYIWWACTTQKTRTKFIAKHLPF